MTYRDEGEALRAERDALHVELEDESRRRAQLERELSGDESDAASDETRTHRGGEVPGGVKIALGVALLLPLVIVGVGVWLCRSQARGAELGALRARARRARVASIAPPKMLSKPDVVDPWGALLGVEPRHPLDKAIYYVRKAGGDRDLGIVAAYVAIAARDELDATRMSRALSRGSARAKLRGRGAIGCALRLIGQHALGDKLLDDFWARLRDKSEQAGFRELVLLAKHCARIGGDVRALLQGAMARVKHGRERELSQLFDLLVELEAHPQIDALSRDGRSPVFAPESLPGFIAAAVTVGARGAVARVSEQVERRASRASAGTDDLAVAAYVAARLGRRDRATRLVAKLQRVSAAKLSAASRAALARSCVLLGRLAEAKRYDNVAVAEERTRVALERRALAALADLDKVPCLRETTLPVALALARGGDGSGAHRRVSVCLANDPMRGPVSVLVYRALARKR